MAWEKLGLIFCPDNHYPWMRTHAANPTAEHVEGDIFRVYFSCRDENNRSSIGNVEIDITNHQHVISISKEPTLTPGQLGAFDYDGVSLACILPHNKEKYLYYLGWCLCKSVPWNNSIGLAMKRKNESSFERYLSSPLLGRDPIDPLSTSYPWVMNDDGIWKMWYGTHLKWNDLDQPDLFDHVVKYAESVDGIHWKKTNTISINIQKEKGEYAISKPCVLKENGIYKMWYSHRGKKYRIGYAESVDGVSWTRKDSEVGIDVSESGWDSESVEYPCVFKHKDEKYMFYNGNDYGKSGFGLAIWR